MRDRSDRLRDRCDRLRDRFDRLSYHSPEFVYDCNVESVKELNKFTSRCARYFKQNLLIEMYCF